MAELYYISTRHTFRLPHAVRSHTTRHLASLCPLVKTFLKKGNAEYDVSRATVVVLDTSGPEASPASHSVASDIDSLSFGDKVVLLRYFFSHLNLIVVGSEDLNSKAAVNSLNDAITKINEVIKNRISRVAMWTGTGININDHYARQESVISDVHIKISDIISTMSFTLGHHANVSDASGKHIIALKNAIVNSIDFKSLLDDSSAHKLQMLCHCVGHWAFPAHELSNDDLAYCVFLIFGFAINYLKEQGAPDGLHLLSPNELMAFVYFSRDTYKNGNPFHNFRHAVDVLQACFHYLVKLGCLPAFEQFEENPKADVSEVLSGKTPLVPCSEFVTVNGSASKECTPPLSPLQSLGLLVSALGHDVGHPGVTNAFMIKFSAPTSQIFSERSVLESFHSSVFINKILSINWPSLLAVSPVPGNNLNMKQLIISSILATDMAEHFDYIHQLSEQRQDTAQPEQIKLIASLLIKCADISNVTRPVRISSQWASVLSREFAEVSSLERTISENSSEFADVSYPQLPHTLGEILENSPDIHKGQLFFIETFAEGLFNVISEHFSELQFTSDIIAENKKFWLNRAGAKQ